jgi:hypothetical protein
MMDMSVSYNWLSYTSNRTSRVSAGLNMATPDPHRSLDETANFIEDAIDFLDDPLGEKFHTDGYFSVMSTLWTNLLEQEGSYEGLEIAVSTAGVKDSVQVVLKGHVARRFEEQIPRGLSESTVNEVNSTLLHMDIEAFSKVARNHLNRCLRSTADLAFFLKWFLQEPDNTAIRHSGGRIPRFKGYRSRTYWGRRETLPQFLPREVREHIKNVEMPFMDRTVCGIWLPDDHGFTDPDIEHGLKLVKALSEWLWMKILEDSTCQNELRIAFPNKAETLMNLYSVAMGGTYQDLDDPEEDDGDEPEEGRFGRETSPTLGLALLRLKTVKQGILLGLRGMGIGPDGGPCPDDVLDLIMQIDKSQDPFDQQWSIGFYETADSRNVSLRKLFMDRLRSTFTDTIPGLCIAIAMQASIKHKVKDGDDFLIDEFRKIAKNSRAGMMKAITLKAEELDADGKLEVEDIWITGSDHKEWLNAPLISLCDHVWRVSTGQRQLHLNSNRPEALRNLKVYENSISGTAASVAPAMKSEQIKELTASGVMTVGSTPYIAQLADYPFTVRAANTVYAETPIKEWKNIEAKMRMLGI